MKIILSLRKNFQEFWKKSFTFKTQVLSLLDFSKFLTFSSFLCIFSLQAALKIFDALSCHAMGIENVIQDESFLAHVISLKTESYDVSSTRQCSERVNGVIFA